jgi:TusE/DsrC/DsvC family sulfur relay protein
MTAVMELPELTELKVKFDPEGFMTDPNQWTPQIAEVLGRAEGIDPLTERHWQVIRFVRAEFEKSGESPTLRTINKKSGVETKELYELFPKGPAKKVARIAGLGKPKGCI